ncbi:MAG TPA: DUF4352 domain-containing protein [Ktedonobacteraceae bacterium]|nr:DUF4352 domain-containing protein [Ktedonobacteraceae bacterium]
MYQPPQNPDEPGYPPPQQPSYPQQTPPQGYPLQQPYYPPQYVPPPQKKSRTWLWIVLGVLAILILGCIGVSTLVLRSAGTAINSASTTVASTVTTIAETPTTQGQPASQVSQVGGTITVNDVAVTLVSVKKLAGDQFIQPKAGNIFIVVHVKIVNNGTGEVDYNPFDFHARSGAGNITDEEVAPSTYTANNELSSGKLSAGGTVEGDIIFQVPKNDHKAQMTWQPSFLGNAGDNAWNLGL